LAIRAGVPTGVFNVVTGSAGAGGNELTSNQLVAQLSFTGPEGRCATGQEPVAKELERVYVWQGGAVSVSW
ncbi:aldehyde dehydrogenase family protein, partial [Escherichia coli]|uniref:aldehyde dehydrogenase family protein n=1 Tax=Escherichia coli TaxID=562 RepID=UPI0010CBC153